MEDKIIFIAGINYDQYELYHNNEVHRYIIGYNASWNKKYAKYAHEDVINAKKYGWGNIYYEKSFIEDIIINLFGNNWDNLNIWSRRNIFTNTALIQEELFNKIISIKKENEDK